jgi:predicted SAM-dependent methyltransferase
MLLKVKNIIKRIKNHFLQKYYSVKHKISSPKYPKNIDNKVYIHLGCGEINSPEFINVDGRFFPHIHHISDVNNLPFFKNDFADLIYASHILEHVPMIKQEEILLEWRRILKIGGTLRIGVPDFDTILKIYKDNGNDINLIWKPLMGGQDYEKNFHFAVFNKNYLSAILTKCGFHDIRTWEKSKIKNHDFNDWTSSKYEVNHKNYNISLNIEATK